MWGWEPRQSFVVPEKRFQSSAFEDAGGIECEHPSYRMLGPTGKSDERRTYARQTNRAEKHRAERTRIAPFRRKSKKRPRTKGTRTSAIRSASPARSRDQGARVRTQASRTCCGGKRPSPPGHLYCFKCREPKPPAEGVVIVQAISDKVSNISAVCPTCGGTMYRRASNHRLKEFEANSGGPLPKAVPRIGETTDPSLNCDFNEEH